MTVDLLKVLQKLLAIHSVEVNRYDYPYNFSDIDTAVRNMFDQNYDWQKTVNAYASGFDRNVLYIVEDILGAYYAVFLGGQQEHPSVIIAGPFIYSGKNFDANLYLKNGYTSQEVEILRGYLLQLPHVHENVINHQLTAVLSAAAEGDVEIKNIKEHLSRVSADNRFSFVYVQENERLSMSRIEQRYAVENEILQAVALGNLSQARKVFGKMFDQDVVERYSPSIHAQKKSLITMNTLFRKSIEQAGVHPYYLDEISYRFFQKIDLVTNRREQAALLNEMLSEYCEYARNYSVEKYSPIVQKAINCIHLNIANNISLKDIAQTLEITPNHLARLFSKETGKTVVEYINHARVTMAANRLKQSRDSVAEIAAAVGFADTNYFSRMFKKYIGCSPSDYRTNSKR